MKKTIIALLALGSVAMASTNVQVDGSIELNGTQATMNGHQEKGMRKPPGVLC